MKAKGRSGSPQAPLAERCAIYTRKSTDHNLDLAFNSLDAQREACEAYVRSQAHEGWTLVPDRFDDGAFSGASLERPALQALLEQVRARRVDIIVVYKVDRLTRALADFAKLVELFDEHEVSFVSVTQSFNTTSSMGRLTLNVLLSFAQFEREVIGERVRDKISASKRKGIWVGGPIPLGYRSVNKRLEIVPEDAEVVRQLFADCLRLGSVGAVVAERNAAGIRPAPRKLTNGRLLQARCYHVGPLAHLLKNRFYIGEVVYRGEAHQGDHPPIIVRDLFEAVQALIAGNAVPRKLARSGSGALLAGRIFDDRGNRMSPAHASKAGVRYRYYVSQALLQHQKEQAGSRPRVSAPDVEAAILGELRRRFQGEETLSDQELVERYVAQVIVQEKDIELVLQSAPGEIVRKDSFQGESPLPRRDGLAGRDSIRSGDSNGYGDDKGRAPRNVDGDLVSSGHRNSLNGAGKHLQRAGHPYPSSEPDAPLAVGVLTIPFKPHHPPARTILDPAAATPCISTGARDTLLNAIARARGWAEQIQSDPSITTETIAARDALAERHVRFLLPLAFLSPAILTAIVDGTAPANMTVTSLAKALPHRWADQERMHLAASVATRADSHSV